MNENGTLVRDLRRWLGQLQEERRSWEPFWRDVKDYIVPDRGRYLCGESATEVNDGSRKDTKIINGAATKASGTMAAGMSSGLTSKAREWFDLSHPDDSINQIVRVKKYYKFVKKQLFEGYDRSNLYNALHNVYEELGNFGTGPIAVLEHPEKVFYFRSFTAGSYYLSSNSRLEVDAFFMFEYLTAKQMLDKYGIDNLSRQVVSALNNNRYEDRFRVDVAVLKEPQRLKLSVPRDMPVAEIHFDSDRDHCKPLMIKYYRSFPILTPRWNTIGEDVYGYPPTRDIIGNAKMLQQMEREKLQALRKIVSPPLQGPSEFERRGINASPGGYNAIAGASGDGIRPLYLVNPDITGISNEISKVVNDIQRGFYNDLFLMLQQRDMINRAPMTATEVESRDWEKMLSLGPVLESIHYELLNPLIDRSIQLLYFAGRIPEPPPELLDSPSKVEYLSILSQAQKAVSVKKLESAVSFVGGITGILPNAPKMIKTYNLVSAYNRAIGLDPDIQATEEEFNGAVASDQQMVQAAQQAKIGGDIAQAAKVASEMDLGNLNEITGNMIGGGGGRMVI